LFRRDKEFKSWQDKHASNGNGQQPNGGELKESA
jgi:hypothetical protein